jgi:hypothetical protein
VPRALSGAIDFAAFSGITACKRDQSL